MVLDILVAIGLKEAGSFLEKGVLLPLLQAVWKIYAQDFFKDCISDGVGLASQEPAKKAMAESLSGVFKRQAIPWAV